MPATVFFQNTAGDDIATLTMTFVNSSGVPTDPTVATCVITDPTGASVTHTVGGGPSPNDITHVGTGVFQLLVGSTIIGLWSFNWDGTGTASDLTAGTWTVNPAATINQFYTSVEEVKDRLNITDALSDFQLQVAVQSAARAIEGMTGRFFYRLTETRVYEPYGIYDLPVDDVVSVTTLKTDEDGDGVFETTWTVGTDYQLVIGDEFNTGVTGEQRPYNRIRTTGNRIFPFTWPFSRADRIQIVGVWGWPAVPFAVKTATMQVAAELFKLKDSPFGLAGSSEFGMVRLGRANPYVVKLLTPYISPQRKVGV